jgi:hypothetical protein
MCSSRSAGQINSRIFIGGQLYNGGGRGRPGELIARGRLVDGRRRDVDGSGLGGSGPYSGSCVSHLFVSHPETEVRHCADGVRRSGASTDHRLRLTGHKVRSTDGSAGSTSCSSRLTGGSSGLTDEPSRLTGDASGLTDHPSVLTRYPSGLTDDRLRLMGTASELTGDPLRLTPYPSELADARLGLTDDRLGLAGHPLALTDDRLGLTNDPSGLAGHKITFTGREAGYARTSGFVGAVRGMPSGIPRGRPGWGGRSLTGSILGPKLKALRPLVRLCQSRSLEACAPTQGGHMGCLTASCGPPLRKQGRRSFRTHRIARLTAP